MRSHHRITVQDSENSVHLANENDWKDSFNPLYKDLVENSSDSNFPVSDSEISN